jgi:mannose-6-phosphate isomerase-like protein (cupin superfamily)
LRATAEREIVGQPEGDFVMMHLLMVALVAIAGCHRGGEGAKPQIVPPGTARTLNFPGAFTTVLLEGPATEGDVAVLEFVVAPRSFGAPPHVHHNEDEYFYVLEGEVQFLNEQRVVAAPVGTFAVMTRGHLHAFWNASDTPARLLLAIAPGKVGAFFDQVVAELRASGTQDPAKIGETIARVGREWNVDTHPELVPDEAKPFLPH